MSELNWAVNASTGTGEKELCGLKQKKRKREETALGFCFCAAAVPFTSAGLFIEIHLNILLAYT